MQHSIHSISRVSQSEFSECPRLINAIHGADVRSSRIDTRRTLVLLCYELLLFLRCSLLLKFSIGFTPLCNTQDFCCGKKSDENCEGTSYCINTLSVVIVVCIYLYVITLDLRSKYNVDGHYSKFAARILANPL